MNDLYSKIWIIKTKIIEKYRYRKRSKYFSNLRKVFDNCSIISSNCFAGRIMQDLGLQYNSPTEGLYIWYPDYIELLTNLKFYLTEANLEFVEQSKYQLGNERRAKWEHWYPIGLLGGKIEITFLHYHTEAEAAEKWQRRCKRINWDNLFVIGMEQNLCTLNDIYNFDKLPYENKIMFTSHNIPHLKSNCFLSEFESKGEIGNPYNYSEILYKAIIMRFKR